MNPNGRPIVIKNSPIEFVVSGPMAGRDRILIRSENAGVDLVGKSIHSAGYKQGKAHRVTSSLIFGGPAELHTVVSGFVADFRSDVDDRESMMALTWRGYATSRGVEEVKDTFLKYYRDIYAAYYYGDENDVELQVAPLIYQCSFANDSAIRSRGRVKFLLGVYALLGLGLSLWSVIRYFKF
ncbi:hypothetical protein [Pseudomonas sp. H2_H09]